MTVCLTTIHVADGCVKLCLPYDVDEAVSVWLKMVKLPTS